MEAIRFKSGELELEGALYRPDEATAIVVICHPHPLHGGDMHNNVVEAMAEALQSGGIGALTFNFRGVGGSEGSHDNGAGEQDDARAAIAYAAAIAGVERVGLAGYSFGAGIAAAIADEAVGAVALVSPPDSRLAEATALMAYEGAVLLMAGSQDHVASTEAMVTVARARPGDTGVLPVPGVDHFWRGGEAILCDSVVSFFADRLSDGPEASEE